MLFDSHCHLTADAFDDDRAETIERARQAGLVGMTCIASTPEDADQAIALAEANPDIWATCGVHPHEAGNVRDGWDLEVSRRLSHPRVVAVGECGLDFHYDFAPREQQFAVFGRQIELAAESGLPLIVHSRSADDEVLGFLQDLPSGVKGVLHCFSGGFELLEAALAKGWYISFAGVVTFKKFDGAELVRSIPAERLLVETDSPYLAPVPHRGRRNEPAFVARTADTIAGLRGVPIEDLVRQTGDNARQFYGLSGVSGSGADPSSQL